MGLAIFLQENEPRRFNVSYMTIISTKLLLSAFLIIVLIRPRVASQHGFYKAKMIPMECLVTDESDFDHQLQIESQESR